MTNCTICKKEFEKDKIWNDHDKKYGDICEKCQDDVQTEVFKVLDILVEPKPIIIDPNARDSSGNVKYNCPYCNFDHWHRDYIDGCPHKYCSQCGGKYEI
jgi:hypothetical protein